MASLFRSAFKFQSPLVHARPPVFSQVRYGSGLKETKLRIKSIRNIQKITKTMKMIASARLKTAQNRMEDSRPFAKGATTTLNKIAGLKNESADAKNLYIVLSTDRGLCGAINSQLVRTMRAQVDDRASEEKNRFSVLGEKVTAQLGRTHGKFMLMSTIDLSKGGNNFFSISVLIDKLLAQEGADYDNIYVLFNKFNSVISFTPTLLHVPSRKTLLAKVSQGMPELDDFEFEDDFKSLHLADLAEYHLASTVFNGMLENQASELGARMTSMDTATTNAGEMIKRLEIKYNRGRQAAITTELIEIISGAEALKTSKVSTGKVEVPARSLQETMKVLRISE